MRIQSPPETRLSAPAPIPLGCDEPAILRLNNDNAQALSVLDRHRFAMLVDRAFYASRIADDAFLIAFDQDADYDSPNFQWFRARLPRFIYIDRVAVAPKARGTGMATTLYTDLIARAASHDRLACEINLDPPNPASDAAHAALGFTEYGRAELANGRTVRYLTRPITA